MNIISVLLINIYKRRNRQKKKLKSSFDVKCYLELFTRFADVKDLRSQKYIDYL